MLSNSLSIATFAAWLVCSHTSTVLAFRAFPAATRQVGLVRTRTTRSGSNGKLFDKKTLSTKAVLQQSHDWIDEVEYVEDDEDESKGPPVRPDMKYLPRNVMRQHKNFVAIREAGGKELTNDVYIREPNSEVVWFVGKVARVSDVTVEQGLD